MHSVAAPRLAWRLFDAGHPAFGTAKATRNLSLGMEALVRSCEVVQAVADPKGAADLAGLRYVTDAAAGISRRKSGTGFTYLTIDGEKLSSPRALARIKKLAIPPAWTDVWICPFAEGHIQATGRDARGRKQYKYHEHFRAVRDSNKYEHMVAFGQALPGIRAKVQEHLSLRGLPREKVLATVVQLLELTLIRVGNNDYAKSNKSYGLTTLKNRHADVNGSQVRFRFTGKGGKQWSLRVRDRRIAKIIRHCQDLPGQELIQYLDGDGKPQKVTSGDVNDYLRDITGLDITAKDFRTWAGTVLAAMALREFESFDSAAQAKRNVRQAISRVAARLGNTSTICRKCYIHPDVINSYLDGNLVLKIKAESQLRENLAGLEPEEAAVLAMLRENPGPRPGFSSGSDRRLA
jgi:DNA topoisomerase-1